MKNKLTFCIKIDWTKPKGFGLYSNKNSNHSSNPLNLDLSHLGDLVEIKNQLGPITLNEARGTLAGIYTIINHDSQRIYVGQSTNLADRINSHKAKLKQGVHNNSLLQADYNALKDKFDDDPLLIANLFTFQFICVINLIIEPKNIEFIKHTLEIREKQLINKFEKSNLYDVYNLIKTSSKSNSNNTQSKSMKSKVTIQKHRSFVYYGERYDSFTQGEKLLGINRNTLSEMAKDKKNKQVRFLTKGEEYENFSSIPEFVLEFVDPKTKLYLNKDYKTNDRTLYFFFIHPFSHQKIPFDGANACSEYLKKIFHKNPNLEAKYNELGIYKSPSIIKKAVLDPSKTAFLKMNYDESLNYFENSAKNQARPVSANHVIFASASQVAAVLNLGRKLIQKWCSRKTIKNWKYITLEEYDQLLSLVDKATD